MRPKRSGKACDIVKWLYDYYNRNVDCMSDEYIEIKEKEGRQRGRLRLYFRHDRPICRWEI